MHSTTVAVDLAKNVFELAVADSEGKIGERLRLNRARFSSFFVHRAPCRVLMEACGSAHYWARRIGEHGHAVQLLPAQYVRQYVRRNKTDRADAAALIEAARCTAIRTVPPKSLEQQQVLVLHRLRSQWINTQQRYLNTLRGGAARIWYRSSTRGEGRASTDRSLSCTTPARAARSDPSIAGPDAQRGQGA
jgi:transposase